MNQDAQAFPCSFRPRRAERPSPHSRSSLPVVSRSIYVIRDIRLQKNTRGASLRIGQGPPPRPRTPTGRFRGPLEGPSELFQVRSPRAFVALVSPPSPHPEGSVSSHAPSPETLTPAKATPVPTDCCPAAIECDTPGERDLPFLRVSDADLPELADLVRTVPANVSNKHRHQRGPRKQTQTAPLF